VLGKSLLVVEDAQSDFTDGNIYELIMRALRPLRTIAHAEEEAVVEWHEILVEDNRRWYWS
jgi:hypothetical protein